MKSINVALIALVTLGCGSTTQEAGPRRVVQVEIGAQNPHATPNEPPHDVEYDRDGNMYFEPVSQDMDDLMSAVADHPDLFPSDKPLPLIHEVVYPLIDEKMAAMREGRPIEVLKWHSAVFHGTTFNGSVCYDTQSNNVPCFFPRRKNQNILQGGGVGNQFFCSAASLAAGDANVTKMPKALADLYMNEALRGMTLQERSSIPMLVRVTMPAGTTSVPNTLGCSAAQPDKLGSTMMFGEFDAPCQAGLPGHNGVNPTCAKQNIDIETTLFPAKLYAALIKKCNFTAATLASNTTIIAGYARYVGVHEFMHSLGFGHFTSGVLKPVFVCSNTVDSNNKTIALMTTPFVSAMTLYSGGHENDDGIIHNVGLPIPFSTPGATEDLTVTEH